MARVSAKLKNARRRLFGHRVGAPFPIGMKYQVIAGVRVLVADPAQRRVMQEIERLRDIDKMTWPQISDELEDRLARAAGRRPLPMWDRALNRDVVMRMYKAEKKLVAKAVADLERLERLHSEGWPAESPEPLIPWGPCLNL